MSIVGGGRFAGEAASAEAFPVIDKIVTLLFLIASFNFFIGMFNFVPLLPLDGGHIAFSILEGIRGRAVAREVYERVSVVGIAVVLLLFFIGLSNDIGRLGD